MRASYLEDLQIQQSYKLSGDEAHHLLNVVRVEMGEEILLLNGVGLMVKTKVVNIAKRELELEFIESQQATRDFQMDLALGIPKKEALELSLKQAVELGFSKIYLVRSQYSQTRVPEKERLTSLLVSALEQSNAPFMPQVAEMNWSEIPKDDYQEIMMLDSQNKSAKLKKTQKQSKRLLVVGPEGGFSPAEAALLHEWPNLQIVNLPTPILRTPTAVAAGAGILLGSLLD